MMADGFEAVLILADRYDLSDEDLESLAGSTLGEIASGLGSVLKGRGDDGLCASVWDAILDAVSTATGRCEDELTPETRLRDCEL